MALVTTLVRDFDVAKKQRKLLGRYIVADPEICHGKPTFLGTRVMVWQVLGQVAKGMAWDAISAQWRGNVSKEAIAEAVEIAQRTFEDHADEYAQESLDAEGLLSAELAAQLALPLFQREILRFIQ